jgi:hypothetical protein
LKKWCEVVLVPFYILKIFEKNMVTHHYIIKILKIIKKIIKKSLKKSLKKSKY